MQYKYSRERPQTYYIIRYFLRNVSASFTFRNISSETIVLYFLEETEKENIGLDPKMLTTLRMTIDRFFSKKIPFLKLSAALFCLNY